MPRWTTRLWHRFASQRQQKLHSKLTSVWYVCRPCAVYVADEHIGTVTLGAVRVVATVDSEPDPSAVDSEPVEDPGSDERESRRERCGLRLSGMCTSGGGASGRNLRTMTDIMRCQRHERGGHGGM